MSMLVDVSYFISGPRQIRNATTAKMPTAEGLSANNVIYGYIRSFQRKFLNDVVGFTLAGQITDYLEIIEMNPQKQRMILFLLMNMCAGSYVNLLPIMYSIIFYVT